jgi:hypothetical protein
MEHYELVCKLCKISKPYYNIPQWFHTNYYKCFILKCCVSNTVYTTYFKKSAQYIVFIDHEKKPLILQMIFYK